MAFPIHLVPNSSWCASPSILVPPWGDRCRQSGGEPHPEAHTAQQVGHTEGVRTVAWRPSGTVVFETGVMLRSLAFLGVISIPPAKTGK